MEFGGVITALVIEELLNDEHLADIHIITAERDL
jgi:hypothetical protein